MSGRRPRAIPDLEALREEHEADLEHRVHEQAENLDALRTLRSEVEAEVEAPPS